jgi:hypothetical protein
VDEQPVIASYLLRVIVRAGVGVKAPTIAKITGAVELCLEDIIDEDITVETDVPPSVTVTGERLDI